MQGYLDVDMHNHTTGSDGKQSPLLFLLRASNRGKDTVSMSDHDSVKGYTQLKKQVEDYLTYYNNIENDPNMTLEQKAKAKKEGTTQFSDLIGGFWSKSNMSWEDVLHLPYYTFYFLLERLKITDNYETQLRCMLAGADMKDKPLHHWLEGQPNDEE